ncbi:hypothetical protein ACNO8S_16560 (plasmid) [Haloarcula sp. KBTZ06]|uniref:hypothetical protein n=1 Tax=Haloarcula sp. KBTZ06 TaxID=3402682 RepID=UPI003B4354F9
MSEDITKLEDGRIHVRISSKRGTGTRDEDKAVAETVYPDFEAAMEESWKLNQLISDRLKDARRVTNPPEEKDSYPDFRSESRAQVDRNVRLEQSDPEAEIKKPEKENQQNLDFDTSKVYLGEEVELSGWIQVPRDIVYDEIGPLVVNNQVEKESSGVKVNFSSDVPISGWKTVRKEIVFEEIVPIVKENRCDGGTEPKGKGVSEGEATCPLDWCSYSGNIEQVLGHVMASDDHTQAQQPQIECPVEHCHKTGAVGTIAGHFFSIWDEEHTSEKLLETDAF